MSFKIRKTLSIFLFSFLFFLSFFSIAQAQWCDWTNIESSNCFPVSSARDLGINLDATSGSWTYTYCQDVSSSALERYVCINPRSIETVSECPSSGYNCSLYQEAVAPGPVAGGFTRCTVGNTHYSCCPDGNLIINGRCISFEDWSNLTGNCCDRGQSTCTTDSGAQGWCSPYNGGFACGGQGVCQPLPANTDDPGEQYCICSLGQGEYNCRLSKDNSTTFGAASLSGCADWAVPNTGQCPDTLTTDQVDAFTDTCRDSNCYGVVECVSVIPDQDFITEYKEHGESCTLYYDQADGPNDPAPHDCNPAEGLWCHPTYNVCVYPDNSRGGWNAGPDESSCVWDDECVTGVGYNQGEYDDLECVTPDRTTLCDLSNVRSDCSCRFPESIQCEWTPVTDAESDYYGRPSFCVSGFRSAEDLQASDAVFDCENNCGGLLAQFAARLSGWSGQHVSLNGFDTEVNDEGFYYTCMTGDFDGSIKAAIEDCLRDRGLLTVYGGGAGAIVGGVGGALIPGANVVTVPIAVVGGAGGGAALANEISQVVFQCAPTISGSVEMANGWNSCQANLRIEVDMTTEAGDLETTHDPYFLCEDNLGVNSPAFDDCMACYGDDIENAKIWTSIGCIDQDPRSIISKFITVGTGILGGIFLLRVLAAAFMLTTSQGDVKKTSEAKEMITQAIIGVLFVIFSVTILQFIGSDVMKIPGFGG